MKTLRDRTEVLYNLIKNKKKFIKSQDIGLLINIVYDSIAISKQEKNDKTKYKTVCIFGKDDILFGDSFMKISESDAIKLISIYFGMSEDSFLTVIDTLIIDKV